MLRTHGFWHHYAFFCSNPPLLSLINPSQKQTEAYLKSFRWTGYGRADEYYVLRPLVAADRLSDIEVVVTPIAHRWKLVFVWTRWPGSLSGVCPLRNGH